MNNWLISIVVVSILTFLIKILLPDGKTKNLVAFILSVLSALIIVLPVKNINLNSIDKLQYDAVSFDFDDEYVEFFNECRSNYYLSVAKYELNKIGVKINYAEFVFENEDENSFLKKIIINKEDLVIIENCEHINIVYEISSTLARLFSIKIEDVAIL